MGVRGGLDYIIHTALAQYDTSIADRLSQSLPHSHACLLLDLTNCWNQVSREAALEELHSNPCLHILLPYFELMYQPPNLCYFYTPDGTVQSFTQEDGFPQEGIPSPRPFPVLSSFDASEKSMLTSSLLPPPANVSVNLVMTA
jgi:hypothetical protein